MKDLSIRPTTEYKQIATDPGVFELIDDTTYQYTVTLQDNERIVSVEVKVYTTQTFYVETFGNLEAGQEIQLVSEDGFIESIDYETTDISLYSSTWLIVIDEETIYELMSIKRNDVVNPHFNQFLKSDSTV